MITFEHLKALASGIRDSIPAAAVIVGGIWVLLRFVRNREAYPRVEFDVDVNFVLKQGDFWIVEAVAHFDNKGLVRHNISKFTFSIRYLTASDPVEPDQGFLVCMPHSAAKGTWLPDSWGDSFVEPGIHTRYSSLARIPKDATAILIHGKFFYENKDWHTADKLLAVPPLTGSMSIPKIVS